MVTFSEPSYVFSGNIAEEGYVFLGSLRPQKCNKLFYGIFVDIFIEHAAIVKTELRKMCQRQLALSNKKKLYMKNLCLPVGAINYIASLYEIVQYRPHVALDMKDESKSDFIKSEFERIYKDSQSWCGDPG